MAFSFFRKKQPIEQRQAQRTALAARLAEAESAVAEAQLAATEIALEGGNDTALDRAESNIRSRQARVTTLNEAIGALDEEIAAQATQEAADADKKQRAATSREINKFADAIENAIPDIVTALRRGHSAIEAGRFLFGEIGLYKLLEDLESSLPSSFAILASEMRARAEQTVAGHAPAVLPTPEVIIPPAPLIARTRVFALQNLKWMDPETHRLALCQRYDFAELPVELANKALESNVAVAPDNPRIREAKHLRRGAPPLPDRCVDLDTGKAPAPPAGIVPWDAFRHLDRGPPVAAFMPAPSFEPAAARSVPTNNEPNDVK
jgi:hypothetical protein